MSHFIDIITTIIILENKYTQKQQKQTNRRNHCEMFVEIKKKRL